MNPFANDEIYKIYIEKVYIELKIKISQKKHPLCMLITKLFRLLIIFLITVKHCKNNLMDVIVIKLA